MSPKIELKLHPDQAIELAQVDGRDHQGAFQLGKEIAIALAGGASTAPLDDVREFAEGLARQARGDTDFR